MDPPSGALPPQSTLFHLGTLVSDTRESVPSMRGDRGTVPPRRTLAAQGWVSASEIAEAAYCIHAYQLTRVRRVGRDVAANRRLAAGTEAHQAYGMQFRVQRLVARTIPMALGIAVVAALALLIHRWMAS